MIRGVRASSIRIEFDLVDDGVVVPALHHLGEVVFHVVAQVVEAVFVVGAVGDVAVVGELAVVVVEAVHDDADREPEEGVDLAHPVGVAAGEVVVDRDHVHALAGEGVEVDGQRRHQRLALARLHLGDAALVQDHAADQLHVEVTLPESALGRLAHGGEGRHQDIVDALAPGKLRLESVRARPQRLVRQAFELLLQGVDGRDAGLVGLDPPVVGGAENFLRESAEHLKPVVDNGIGGAEGRLIDLIVAPRI